MGVFASVSPPRYSTQDCHPFQFPVVKSHQLLFKDTVNTNMGGEVKHAYLRYYQLARGTLTVSWFKRGTEVRPLPSCAKTLPA